MTETTSCLPGSHVPTPSQSKDLDTTVVSKVPNVKTKSTEPKTLLNFPAPLVDVVVNEI